MDKTTSNSTNDTIKYVFWTILLQGISYILLGFLIIFYPAIIVILVATTFMWMGVISLALAWRVRKYRSLPPKVVEFA